MADIDFRKKRGLLEEINLAVKEAELADREYQDLIDAQLRQQEEGPIDVNQPGEKEPAKEPGQTAPPEPKKLEGAPGSSEEPPAGPSSAVPPAPAPVKEGVEG